MVNDCDDALTGVDRRASSQSVEDLDDWVEVRDECIGGSNSVRRRYNCDGDVIHWLCQAYDWRGTRSFLYRGANCLIVASQVRIERAIV